MIPLPVVLLRPSAAFAGYIASIKQGSRVVAFPAAGGRMNIQGQNFQHCTKTDLPEPVRSWAGKTSEYPRHRTVASLFEEIAASHPDRIAVISNDARMTYAELNARANRIAHRLRRLGMGPDDLVGVCMERSVNLIAALVGVLKAGAAYVPIDAAYPRERIRFILEDTGARLVIVEEDTTAILDGLSQVVPVFFDDPTAEQLPGDRENPPGAGSATSLAYVMYTSGSTGRPKGVMVENRSIVRLVRNTNYCALDPDSVLLQSAPVSFDASTFEIWGALLNGARLVIGPRGRLAPAEIGRLIETYGVTTLWLTAALFHLMVSEHLEALRPLRQLLAGGDVLSPAHVRRVLEALPHLKLINGYGPTENTTFTCCHPITLESLACGTVPIGRPIANTRVYILDAQRNPVPVGQTGELYTGGDGVARGYLHSPELTAEKFLRDPFAEIPEAHMYRTGDVARWLEDGTIEFLGRIDNQVKILGHRIEPGEIEVTLAQYPGIAQACVVAREDGPDSRQLVAYFAAESRAAITTQQIRQFLAAKLPCYMVPAICLELPTLPLTANGKVDRAALPAPSLVGEPDQAEGLRSATEELIASIWKQVLHLQHVGVESNFFDLGGNSLKLMSVHSQLQKSLPVTVELVDLFEFTTIRSLARHLSRSDRRADALPAARQRVLKQREVFARRREMRGA